MRALNREGYTIVVAEHEIEELATFADRIIALSEGRIVMEGSTRDVLTKVVALKSLGVDPPSVTELTQILAENADIKSGQFPITLSEAILLYRKIIRG
jgi:energy-coupling factor transporter ATP-binding protein EcfA2